jgi:hypothetical protein
LQGFEIEDLSVYEPSGEIQQPWQHAADRCLASCDHMADILRNTNEAMLEMTSPLAVYYIFIAARFRIIYPRTLNLPISSKFHLLIYALNVCGRWWPLARQLQRVLEGAIAEGIMPDLKL